MSISSKITGLLVENNILLSVALEFYEKEDQTTSHVHIFFADPCLTPMCLPKCELGWSFGPIPHRTWMFLVSYCVMSITIPNSYNRKSLLLCAILKFL